jgi:hypothetical protein
VGEDQRLHGPEYRCGPERRRACARVC